ncbi:MAG: DNA polymerase IV [Gammaproteobacteria bacterium]|nr:DNA polymerase IV [Gammaproteobacteria bacterium]
MPTSPTNYWPRAIIHIDMNAFFAAVEQRDFPELRDRPIGVTNGEAGTTLITCSYEARAFGVKTGMRLYEARRLCPDIVQRPARPRVYAAVSTRIMRALVDLSPDIEVFSVDEAFIDVTHCQRLHGSPPHMAHMARALVQRASNGLPCSIGVAGTKLSAKVASELKKPNGLTVVPPWETRAWLHDLPMEKICGIGPHIAEFLTRLGARTCGDVAALPLNVLVRRYGVVGKHLWLACQGLDTDPVVTEVGSPKSVGHGKVLPPRTTARRTIETYLRHMSEKVAARLRRYGLQTGRLYVGLRYTQGYAEAAFEVPYGPPDGKRFFECARRLLDGQWQGQAVTQVQVTATHIKDLNGQLDLFPADAAGSPGDSAELRRVRRALAIDRINARFGEFTLAPAELLGRSAMPNVIAPAWRPDGMRQHIPD